MSAVGEGVLSLHMLGMGGGATGDSAAGGGGVVEDVVGGGGREAIEGWFR